MKFYLTILFLICLPFFVLGQHSLLQEEFSDPDFTTPANISSHVFNFFHHSSGGNLLNDGLTSRLVGLGYTVHSRINTQYEYENNYTDYRHWYKRFQRELGIKSGEHYYRYEGPDANGNPLLGVQIDDDYQDFMLNYYEFNAELMDIIMFKPCYPGSNVNNYDTQLDATTDNNGYGNVTGGTPYSDNGNNNFSYLNSSDAVDDAYDNSYWSNGNWGSSSSTLAQLKCAYRGLLNIFVNHPNFLFIAMQAPPMVSLSDDRARNCREFARWMREDWLHQYDPTGKDQFQDYPLKNVVPFDFHDAVAWTANDAQLDNEYFWFVQSGMPDNSMDNSNADLIGRSASSEDHPNTWLNQRTATIFCGGSDSYSPAYTGNSGRSYDCWIHAVVNRWEKSLTPVPVELVSFSFEVDKNSVLLQWQTATESNNFGFEIQRRNSDIREFQKIGFVNGNGTTANPQQYIFSDINLTPGLYQYRIKQLDFGGTFEFSPCISVEVTYPRQFGLSQNYPNPFNAQTLISFELPQAAFVKLIIYDVTGRQVITLVNQRENAGYFQALWNGLDDGGIPVSSGVYFYQLQFDSEKSEIKKVIVMK